MASIREQSKRSRDDPAGKLDDHEAAGQERGNTDARSVFLVAAMVVIVRMVMIVVMRMGMRVRLTAESMIVSHAFP